MELKQTHWVDGKLRHRSGDIVWRLRRRGDGQQAWVYLYILLELQARPDSRMALRVLEYVVLFLNSLLNSGEIGPDEPYPVVLPVVLYTGRWPWRGGTSLRERG
ncbi:MAG: Rpn family recombination-promoting nuclease/putative transposase [Pigmentiphaga sp.]|nr:Rpn family recombination-promoting nuclease/putative transposase [Pigmentiphaga sp.]